MARSARGVGAYVLRAFVRARLERRRPPRPDEHLLTFEQLEAFGFLTRHLSEQVTALSELDLDAHLEAEVDDSLDGRFLALAVGCQLNVDVVRTDVRVAQAGDRTDEGHDELACGVLVQIARLPVLLDPPGVDH